MGFIDDDPVKLAGSHPWPVWGRSILQKDTDSKVLAVPGGPLSFRKRKEHIDSLQLPHSRMATVIHPSASIGRQVQLGINCLIMAGVVITSNAIVEDHVCILPNSVVHHDSRIGAYTLMGSLVSVAGGTQIGSNCYIGSGSKIMNGITVGNGVLIGLGSNVIRNVAPGITIAGNPAKELKKP
jgi:sugar O-acyltransferase (sialic acid O-acetyltransferase NeuD family)